MPHLHMEYTANLPQLDVDKALLRQLLLIERPWEVRDYRLDVRKRRCDVWIGQEPERGWFGRPTRLLAVEVIQGELQVAATQLGGHKLEAMLDGGQGDGTPSAGGGLRRGLLDQAMLDQLPGYLGHAGRGQLTQLGNFDPRDGPLQVNESIDDGTVHLLDKIYVCYLSASHSVTVLCSVR